jgi:hypothetical protein
MAATYTHKQREASTIWHVEHLLKKKPRIVVIDELGRDITPTILHNSNTRCTIIFSKPFKGEAYCS